MTKLEINHRTINFNNRTLQLRMVTAVSKLYAIRPLPFKWRTVAIVIVISLAGLFGMTGNGQYVPGLLVGLGAAAFAVYAIKENLKPRDYWILHVETASGSSNLVASSDERVIDDAVQAIAAAMEADASYQHTVIINDSTIVSDAVVQGSIINGMAKSTV